MSSGYSWYRIGQRGDGLVDVLMTPGEVVPIFDDMTGRMDYGIKLMAVCGIDPADPKWCGDLDAHIRAHFASWLAAAEEIEI